MNLARTKMVIAVEEKSIKGYGEGCWNKTKINPSYRIYGFQRYVVDDASSDTIIRINRIYPALV